MPTPSKAMGVKQCWKDALGRTAESYTDAKGRNRETVQHAGGENITVSYAYDPVNQVTTVTHPNSHTTTYEYDELGRKLKVNHTDAGETDMTYDLAGNLLTKLTANLKKSISEKGTITYTYDFERLKEILYPKNLFNRVTYTYGQAGDKYRVHQEFGVIDIINVVVEDNKPPL